MNTKSAISKGFDSGFEMPTLNVGCGADIKEECVNMDAFYKDERIVNHDMCDIPWPFPSNTFKTIYASHVLEHIPLKWNGKQDIIMDIFDEMWRILKPGGRLITRTPMAQTATDYGSPQHFRRWSPDSAYIFSNEGNYYSKHTWTMNHWELKPMGIKAPYFMPIRGLGITSHIRDRLPFLKGLLSAKDDLWMYWSPNK